MGFQQTLGDGVQYITNVPAMERDNRLPYLPEAMCNCIHTIKVQQKKFCYCHSPFPNIQKTHYMFGFF